jgi:hypothetical protein
MKADQAPSLLNLNEILLNNDTLLHSLIGEDIDLRRQHRSQRRRMPDRRFAPDLCGETRTRTRMTNPSYTARRTVIR